jgi:hypothetical protein
MDFSLFTPWFSSRTQFYVVDSWIQPTVANSSLIDQTRDEPGSSMRMTTTKNSEYSDILQSTSSSAEGTR